MLRSILIFLLAVLIAFGSTFALYQDKVTDMIGMIKGETPDEKPDGPSKPDDGPVAVSMEIDTTGAKTVYNFGEEFSTEGLKITVTMSDGTVKEVTPDECKITPPDTTKAGSRVVRVVYGSASARYEVTVNAKVYPSISSTSLVDITEKNDSVPYRVEAELIDMAISQVVKAEGFDSFVATAPEGAAITSGEQYLTGFGVKWNYFGFTFTAAEKYEDTIIVLRVANATGKDIDAGAVKMYLNMTQDENGSPTGEIPLDGYIIKADGACGWYDIVLRHITIPEGTNTLTFEMQDDKVFDLDYVDFYVGMRYINSVVEIQQDTSTIIKDLETLDTEKAFTRQDVADAHGLKPGQLFVEPTKDVPGKTTSGGTAVGAIGKGSQMSTTIRLSQDATVLIKFKASAVGKGAYSVKDHWNFYIDGVKLNTVESVNIEGGDPSQGLWWDWIYTNVGAINLSAGDHFFLLEVHGTDCNVDTVEFEVISFGSFDESGANLEDMKQPDAPDADLVIKGSGEYKFEAEDLDISNLTPSEGQTAAGIESPSGSGPATSGGKSIGMAGGGYVTLNVKLESKATIQIYATLAFAHGGNAADFMSAAIGETELLANGTLPAGEGNMPYWNWAEIPMGGPVELEAGEYAITFNFLKNPNFDCIKIKVISDDGPAEEQFKVTIEAETFDNEGVVTRQDMIDAGRIPAGEYMSESGNGATCICGFTAGTYFKFNVTLEEAKYIEMFLVGATDAQGYDVSTKFSLKVNGGDVTIPSDLLTGTGATPYWDWQTVSFGKFNLNAGDNEIIITILDGHPNLDKVFFVEAASEPTPPPAHSCESVCPECGKCLDAECTESACADKCQGHAPVEITPDVTLSTEGVTKVEMENLDLSNSTIVTRGDFIPAVGAGNVGRGSGRIYGFDNGTTFRIYVKVTEAGSIKISLAGFGTAMSNFTYKFGETTLTPESNYGNGTVVEGVVGTVSVEPGVYCFEFTSGVNIDLDYVAFEILANAPAHECESICPECGKCLDSECTEAACADKCQGHAPVEITPDVTISDASDSYKVEAENISLDTLVPQAGFEKPAIESFAGGKGLGGIGPGGYQSFVVKAEKDATVALKIAFAKYEGGSILTYIPAITVNGEALTLTDGQIAPGTAENQWWNVSNVQVATLTLEAGKTYTIKVSVNSGNLDGYVLEVVTAPAHECESICSACGKCTDSECTEAACAAKCAGHHVDATISGDVDVTLEAENWHYADDAIVTRPDFAPSIGQGNLKSESGNGATCIFAFTAGTKFVINVNAASAMEVDLLLRGATDAQGYEAATKLAVTLNGQPVSGAFGSLTGSGSTPYWDWQTVGLGRLNLVEGINEITITVLDGHPNIDLIKFAPVKDNAPVATPDATPDVTVATTGATKLELETLNLSKSTIVLRSDLIGAGFTAPGNSDGRIWGMADGTTIRLYVKVDAPCTLKLSLGGFGTAMSNFTYTFGGVNMNAEGNYGSGSTAAGLIGNIEITEAGVYLFEFTTGGGVDLDYLTFEVQ